MSISLVNSVVRRFVQGEHRANGGGAATLALRGPWGAGKTFYWKQVLESGKPADRQYGYVSLFGLNSIEEVRSALVVSVAVERVPKGQWRRAMRVAPKAGAALEELLRNVPYLRTLSAAGGALARAVAFEVVRDALVCFDDLERRGDGLRLADVLGLATQLRDERECDVALILNDGQLSDAEAGRDDVATFIRHGEKAVDYQVHFDPTVEEVFQIVYGPTGGFERDVVLDCCNRLGVKNIRVLQRVRRTLEGRFREVIEPLSAAATESAVRSTILLTWARYDAEGCSISFDLIRRSPGNLMYARLKKKEERTADEQGMIELQDRYGHWIGTGLDQQTAHYIDAGWFDEEALAEALRTALADDEMDKVRADTSAAWHLYNGTFDDNEPEAVEQLYATHAEHALRIGVGDMDAVIRVLRELDADEKADSLIRIFENVHQGDGTVQAWRASPFADRHAPRDPAFAACVDRLVGTVLDDRTFASSVGSMSMREGWDARDVAFIASRPLAEYEAHLRSLSGSDWIGVTVRKLLQFGQIAPGSPEYTAIAQKTTEALRSIARSSRLNRMRVERTFDIDLNTDITPGDE